MCDIGGVCAEIVVGTTTLVKIEKGEFSLFSVPRPYYPLLSDCVFQAERDHSIREQSFQWSSTSGNTDDWPTVKMPRLCWNMQLHLSGDLILFLTPGLGLIG